MGSGDGQNYEGQVYQGDMATGLASHLGEDKLSLSKDALDAYMGKIKELLTLGNKTAVFNHLATALGGVTKEVRGGTEAFEKLLADNAEMSKSLDLTAKAVSAVADAFKSSLSGQALDDALKGLKQFGYEIEDTRNKWEKFGDSVSSFFKADYFKNFSAQGLSNTAFDSMKTGGSSYTGYSLGAAQPFLDKLGPYGAIIGLMIQNEAMFKQQGAGALLGYQRSFGGSDFSGSAMNNSMKEQMRQAWEIKGWNQFMSEKDMTELMGGAARVSGGNVDLATTFAEMTKGVDLLTGKNFGTALGEITKMMNSFGASGVQAAESMEKLGGFFTSGKYQGATSQWVQMVFDLQSRLGALGTNVKQLAVETRTFGDLSMSLGGGMAQTAAGVEQTTGFFKGVSDPLQFVFGKALTGKGGLDAMFEYRKLISGFQTEGGRQKFQDAMPQLMSSLASTYNFQGKSGSEIEFLLEKLGMGREASVMLGSKWERSGGSIDKFSKGFSGAEFEALAKDMSPKKLEDIMTDTKNDIELLVKGIMQVLLNELGMVVELLTFMAYAASHPGEMLRTNDAWDNLNSRMIKKMQGAATGGQLVTKNFGDILPGMGAWESYTGATTQAEVYNPPSQKGSPFHSGYQEWLAGREDTKKWRSAYLGTMGVEPTEQNLAAYYPSARKTGKNPNGSWTIPVEVSAEGVDTIIGLMSEEKK